eukprot:gene20278-22264_t
MFRLLGSLFLISCLQWVNCQSPEEGDLFEGDMELTPEQRIQIENSINGGPSIFGAVVGRNWPRKTSIPVKISSSFSSEQRTKIINAIVAFHKKTCLRFVWRSSQSAYLNFMPGTGCSSPVGYGRRVNNIKLGNGCFRHGTIIHEIMHSLGFYHEQSRPDRDSYVRIILNNVPEKRKNNFKKYSTSTIKSGGSPYDYMSVMHYSQKAFGGGKVTIQALDSRYQDRMGQRIDFSSEDVKQIKAKYSCT